MSDFGVYILNASFEKVYKFPYERGEFENNLYGGCGTGRFRAGWRFDLYEELAAIYQHAAVRADVLDEPLWQGRIAEIRPYIDSNGREYIEMLCDGWGLVLQHIMHPQTSYKYRKGESAPNSGIMVTRYSDIVRDLAVIIEADTHSDITVGRIDDSAELPDAEDEDNPAEFTIRLQHFYEVMDVLSTLAGNWQWGVDRLRQFYFYPKPDGVGYWFRVGKDLQEYKPISSTRKIINQLLVRGGTARNIEDEEYRFFYVGEDEASVDRWGAHFDTKSQPEINDRLTAERFCAAVFEESSAPQNRVAVRIIPAYTLCEPSMGRVHIFCPPGHHAEYPILRTQYTFDDKAGLFANPELGVYPPSLATMIEQLKIADEKARKEGAGEEFFRYGDNWDIDNLDSGLSCAFEFTAGPP